jgi:hypothetical protein
MSKTTFETDFVKKLSAEDRALLEMLPKNLDIIQKKQRANIKQRVYQAVYREKLKSTRGVEQYKIDKKEDMKVYRAAQKTKYLEAVEKTAANPVEIKIITNTIQKIEKKQKEPTESSRQSDRNPKPVDRLKIIQDVPKVNTKQQQDMSDKSPAWFIRLIKKFPNYKVNDENYVAARTYT